MAKIDKNDCLNTTALCKIIEVASKSRVKELKLENLHIIFEESSKKIENEDALVEFPAKITDANPVMEQRTLRLDTEKRKDELDLSELMLSDPMGYEEALMSENNGRAIQG